MKKKNMLFMFLSVFALGLTACGNNDSSSADDSTPSSADISTPSSADASTSSSVGGSTSSSNSTAPVTENISASVLRTIMGSFTSDGTMKISYTGGYLPKSYDNIHLAMEDKALETLYYDQNQDKYTDVMQIYNYSDIQCYKVLDADNVVKYAPYSDESGNYVAYDYALLSAYATSLRTTYFEKTVMDTYVVINQNARNLIASTIAATYYYPEYDGDIASMELTVANDVITNIKFATVQQTIQANVKATVSFDLNITNHGTTTIETDIKPYETYAEAKALGDALDALDGNVTIELAVTVEDRDDVYSEGLAYLFDDLFYLSVTSYDENDPYSEAFGYVDYPERNGIMQFVAEDGKFEATRLYQGYSVAEDVYAFEPSFVAPEMFEYKDGKYVTRSYSDISIVSPYLLVDFDGSLDYTGELAITLDDEGNLDTISYDVYFYTDATRTDTEVHHYTFSIIPNANKTVEVEGLNEFKDLLKIYASVTPDIIGIWADDEETYSVEINYGVFKINGEDVTLESVTQTSMTGKIGDVTYLVTYGEDEEHGVPCVDLTITNSVGSFTIRLYYAVSLIDQIADIYGISRLANPEDLGFEFFAIDDTYIEYGQVVLFYAGDFTETTIEEYANMLKAGSYIYDFTNADASQVFSGGSGTVAEYLGMEVVLVSAQYDRIEAIVGIGSYDYNGQTLLVVFILAIIQ